MTTSFVTITRKGESFSEIVTTDLESSLIQAGFIPIRDGRSSRTWDLLGRALPRLGVPAARRKAGSAGHAVVALMGLAERQLYPADPRATYVPYVYDCWPTRERDWAGFFARNRFDMAFFSARVAADHWNGFEGLRSVWMPEAIDDAQYPPGPPLRDRAIVVMELGRPYELAHEIIRRAVPSELHSHPGNRRSMPDRASLIRALHSTRALICYPGAITQPSGRTGSWESMTHRYLEAVATKTVVLGRIPDEMRDLFGFAPGVEVVADDLPDALHSIRTHPNDFQLLVERSHARLLEVATWNVRAKQMLEYLGRA